MARLAAGAVFVGTAIGQEGLPAQCADSFPRGCHVFIPEQFYPYGLVQLRVDWQDTLQKIIAIDGSIPDGRIPGIDDTAIAVQDTSSVDIIAAFFVCQGFDLTYQLFIHVLSPVM